MKSEEKNDFTDINDMIDFCLCSSYLPYLSGRTFSNQCGICDEHYYPTTESKSVGAEDVCNTFCDETTCNSRGVCLKATGTCACFGNCPTDAASYDGTCEMRSTGVQPHLEESNFCGSCDTHWGPFLNSWEISCNYYCNAAATELDSFPATCYDADGFIRSECVFCSGRADNCSSLGAQPVCNCLDG